MTDMQKKMMLMYFAEVHVSLEKQPSKISYNDLHTNFPFKKMSCQKCTYSKTMNVVLFYKDNKYCKCYWLPFKTEQG